MASIAADDEDEPSYIDYETFLDPAFSPSQFANTLVLSTNNPNDLPLDLSTPLSRVLFDIQEIDSHIDLLTTRSALPLLTHTKAQTDASTRIVTDIDHQVKSLNDSYSQLEKEVIQKHTEADEVRQVASRLWETLKLGRSVGRCLQLGRQLEVQHGEITGAGAGTGGSTAVARKEENHRALVRCAHTILSLREILERNSPGEEGYGLTKVDAVRSLQDGVAGPIERSVRDGAERIIREFAVGPPSGSAPSASTLTFAQWEETKARTVSALVTLYLISPTKLAKNEKWTPRLFLDALEIYLRSALSSSVASMARSLSTLPSLDRTLAEVSARCQNVVALETVLETTRTPVHPVFSSTPTTADADAAGTATDRGNLLQPLLAHLETGSLASYFWRSLSRALAMRVQEIISRGGVAARTLRSNRNSVGDAVRECVIKGCQPPSAVAAGKGRKGRATSEAGEREKAGWDREVAVMVGSVVGNLGR